MIRAANRPPLDNKKDKNSHKIQFNSINRDKNKVKSEKSQTSSVTRNYAKKHPATSLWEKPNILIRDHSGTKLFRPRLNESPIKQAGNKSSRNQKVLQISQFVNNCKISHSRNPSQRSLQNPQLSLSFSKLNPKISLTFRNTSQKSNRNIEGESPVGNYQNKISLKKLEFSREKERSFSINTINSKLSSTPPISFKQKNSTPILPTLSDFTKGKRLGKGYFGQVFLVQHKTLHFICAMKTISLQLLRKQKLHSQIIRQLKISLFVSHPNIIQTYGYFTDSTHLYILQELMTEHQLYCTMKQNRVFSELYTARIITQVLSALFYLHSNDITHRDIKPENILLQSGVVKLCDFGWAVYDPNDFRTSYIGTLLYLSPENIKGEGYDKRNDIWGVGVMTYEMLIGNVPFTIWSENEKQKIVYETVRFPRYAEISKTAQEFVMRMLEKDPEKRASIEELQGHPFLNRDSLKRCFSVYST